jgi:hypothetical protein
MYRAYNCYHYRHALHLNPNRADEYVCRIRQPAREAMRYPPMVCHSILDRQWYMASGNPRRYMLRRCGSTPSSAIVSPLSPAAGRSTLSSAGGAGNFPGRGRETEGGEALAMILQYPSSA